MKRILLIAFSVACYTLTFAQTTTLFANYGGLQRRFIVHLPTGYTSGQHPPMVINMHGYGSNDGQQELYTQMDVVADANHFVVVYPNGVDSAWNVGWVGALDAGVNDVGFMSLIIDTMSQLYGIDLNRVYATGMSNGGFMSHKLACDLGNRIAAIASVAGTFSDSMNTTCNPSRKMPVMQIHGTLDPTVPYGGFAGGIGVEATINKWLGYDQCTATNDTIMLANTSTTDNTTVQRITYHTCGDSTEVVFLKVISGGHTWPGAALDIPPYGYTNHDINASQEIWNFFNRYTLQGAVGIDNIAQQEAAIKVYPNPVSSELKVEATSAIKHITLLNMLGELLQDIKLDATSTTLNVSKLTSGIYFLRIEGDKLAVTKRIVRD